MLSKAEYERIFSEIHERGAASFPRDWLRCNESVVHTARRLGYNHTDIDTRCLLSCLTFTLLAKLRPVGLVETETDIDTILKGVKPTPDQPEQSP